MWKAKSRIAAPYPAYLFLLINHPGFIEHSRCPQGTRRCRQKVISPHALTSLHSPSGLSVRTQETRLIISPLLLVYFYPSCVNQSVTYCPTVQSLTGKAFDIIWYLQEKYMTCSLTSKSDLNDFIMKYLMLSGQVDDISAWRIYKTSNLQSQVCTL